MPLEPGSSLGPYHIVSKLGAGGMGEVYRARDAQLGRDVAIKVLPEAFARDADRVARFDREARTLGALNHSNIAHIYGVVSEPHDGRAGAGTAPATVGLVMELVEGDDLSAYIARGAMPVADALPLARQLADALEAAHELGIIHRDLKPANIKVRDDGVVKVLDFGLAKAIDPAAATSPDAMHSPTMTARATAAGMVLGTAAYMSPEQAKGRAVDKRADIWAFGCVVFEMLTARRAFSGDDVTEVLAAVIRDTPAFEALPAGTPWRLRKLIERCLARDPKLRLRDIGEARLELAAIEATPDAAGEAPGSLTAKAAAAPGASRLVWLAAGVAAGLVIALVAGAALSRPATADVTHGVAARFDLAPPADVQLADPGWLGSVSPDGRFLAIAATKGNQQGLWVRAIDSTDMTFLPGTQNGNYPFWSPDAAHVAFFVDGKLKRIDMRTHAVTTICDTSASPGGGTWSSQGVIVFAPMLEGPLFRVSAGGGTPAPLTSLNADEFESAHLWPHFLPDGRHYLYQVLGLNNRGIHAGTIDGADRTLVLKQDRFDMTAVQYASSGHLVYVRNYQLVARPFDLARLQVTGDEVAIADGFGGGGAGWPRFGVSRNGVLAFRPYGADAFFQPTWYSPDGTAQGTLGPAAPFGSMDLSRDGRLLSIDQFTERDAFVSIIDVARGTLTRFTTDVYTASPAWFPDGDRVAYASVRDTPPNPFVRTLAGVETRLGRLPSAVQVYSVTPDGSGVLAEIRGTETNWDIWLFPTSPDAQARVLLQTSFIERHPRVSPGGQWLAFTSNASAGTEVYITSFPTPGQQHRVSPDGGTQARWSADGATLFFRSRNRIVSASVTTSASGAPVIGSPRVLFSLPEGAGQWTVDGNGRRFLVNIRTAPAQTRPITVVVNWPAMLAGR